MPTYKRLAATILAALWLCAGLTVQGRDYAGTATSAQKVISPEQRVDVNHATLAELLRVPGMTSSWAGRIVRFRPYRTKQDLLDKGVVNSQTYDRIRQFVIAHRDRR